MEAVGHIKRQNQHWRFNNHELITSNKTAKYLKQRIVEIQVEAIEIVAKD